MSAYPFASSVKVEETLDVLGTRNIATTQQTLLQQILVACGVGGAAPSAPNTPTEFTATAGNRQIVLTWANQPEADTFTIKYSTTNDIGSATVLTSSATGTSFTFDSGESIQIGEKYYFWISAVSSLGVSAYSSSVTARSFVTVAYQTSRELTPPTGSWTLGTILFGLTPVPDAIFISLGSTEYISVAGNWVEVASDDPSDNVPVVGLFTVYNGSGSAFTFWDTEP